MQVMEVAIAVLDCPFMIPISDLDDINLKGKMGSPCLISNKESPAPPPVIAALSTLDLLNPQAKVELFFPTSLCT